VSPKKIKKRVIGPELAVLLKEYLAKQVPMISDTALVGLYSREQAYVITPSAKNLLLGIHSIVSEIKRIFGGEVPLSISIEMPEAADHNRFKQRSVDIATIEIALDEENPERFFAPLSGGEAFLEHVLRCSSCLVGLCTDMSEFDDLTAHVDDQVRRELAKHGVQPRSGGEEPETILHQFTKPKPQ